MAQPKVFKVVRNRRVPDDYKPKKGEVVKYRFVVDVGENPATGRRQQLTRTYGGKRQAERQLSKILTDVDQGTFAAPTKLTVGAYLTEWERSAVRGKEAATATSYRYALKPVHERCGARLLQKLSIRDVEDLAEWMLTSGRKRGAKAGTGLGPRSVQLTLSRLRSALDDAVRHHLITYNPAAAVKCPPQKPGEKVPWTAKEVRAFLASLSGKRLHAPVMLALMGLRPAETCGLRWSEDVDLDAETISIANTRTLVFVEGVGAQVVEKAPKSEGGKRTLPLPPQVTAALKAFKALQAKEKLAAGEGYTSSGYVLVDELGVPRKTDWLRHNIYRLMTEAGVRKVRPYLARHACLTYLRMSGVPGPIVSAWAGHGDLTMADRVYVHPTVEDLQQGRDKLTELFG